MVHGQAIVTDGSIENPKIRWSLEPDYEIKVSCPFGTGHSELVYYLVFGDGLQKLFYWDICANHTQKDAL